MMPSCMAEEVALGLFIDRDAVDNLITNMSIKPCRRRPRANRNQCRVCSVRRYVLHRSAGSTPTPDSATLNAIFRNSHDGGIQDQALPVSKITVEPLRASVHSVGLTHVSVAASLHSPHRQPSELVFYQACMAATSDRSCNTHILTLTVCLVFDCCMWGPCDKQGAVWPLMRSPSSHTCDAVTPQTRGPGLQLLPIQGNASPWYGLAAASLTHTLSPLALTGSVPRCMTRPKIRSSPHASAPALPR